MIMMIIVIGHEFSYPGDPLPGLRRLSVVGFSLKKFPVLVGLS